MIDVELRLKEIFSYLKPIRDINNNLYKISFDWGTEQVLNKYIQKAKQPYPLIWLVENENEVDNSELTRSARFIIATRSKMPDEFNTFQHSTDFKVILEPVMHSLIKALKVNGTTQINKDYKYRYVKNYSEVKGKTQTIDVWNAIVLDLDIKFINNCIINKKY